MIGVALIVVSTLATEIGCSIGKWTIGLKEKRIYSLGVITNIGGGILIFCFGIFLPPDLFGPNFPGGFVFSAASIPFLAVRIVLELAQTQTTLLSLARTERSSFGFLRTLTLPLLLAVDLLLGYSIRTPQFFGIMVIIVGLLVLFLNHGIRRRGALITLFTAFNAVVTISLYKYDITHFNSVAAEQSIVYVFIVAYFLILSFFVAKENPFSLLRDWRYSTQLLASSIEAVTVSFAYLFAAASVITSAKRALSILWAIGAGHYYFHEGKFFLKLAAFALVVCGILLLAF